MKEHDTMSLPPELSTTRRALHAVAELLIAGPPYEAVGDIRLAARPGGFGGCVGPTPSAVSGTDLITPKEAGGRAGNPEADRARHWNTCPRGSELSFPCATCRASAPTKCATCSNTFAG